MIYIYYYYYDSYLIDFLMSADLIGMICALYVTMYICVIVVAEVGMYVSYVNYGV